MRLSEIDKQIINGALSIYKNKELYDQTVRSMPGVVNELITFLEQKGHSCTITTKPVAPMVNIQVRIWPTVPGEVHNKVYGFINVKVSKLGKVCYTKVSVQQLDEDATFEENNQQTELYSRMKPLSEVILKFMEERGYRWGFDAYVELELTDPDLPPISKYCRMAGVNYARLLFGDPFAFLGDGDLLEDWELHWKDRPDLRK